MALADRLDTHLIHYVDFSDYVKIITRWDNWDEVFSHIFKDRGMVSAKLRELEPTRNAIAPSREVAKEDAVKLRIYGDEVLRAIRRLP